MKRPAGIVLAAIVALACVAHALAADGPKPPRQERVTFAKGASSATVRGVLKGRADVDYVVRAAAGQTLEVRLEGSHAQNDFNVLPPGSADVAMYVSGATGRRAYSGVLPADGDYTVRVYLQRAAARRGETSSYTLTVTLSGKPLPPLAAARDAKVAGTPYHATAKVDCVPPFASAATQCDAGVVRRGFDGTATLELRGGNGLLRRILFVQGRPVASDATDPVRSTRRGDVTVVTVGADERYDVPDALLTGG